MQVIPKFATQIQDGGRPDVILKIENLQYPQNHSADFDEISHSDTYCAEGQMNCRNI